MSPRLPSSLLPRRSTHLPLPNRIHCSVGTRFLTTEKVVVTSKRTSATYRGTLYEYKTISALETYAILATRCGGTGDKGVDFRGSWYLPTDHRIPVVGQCKNRHTRLGPKPVRELLGVVTHETPGTLGILASPKGFTAAAVKQLLGSRSPLLFVTVHEGTCSQITWNGPAELLFSGKLTLATAHPVNSNDAVIDIDPYSRKRELATKKILLLDGVLIRRRERVDPENPTTPSETSNCTPPILTDAIA